MPGWVLDTSVYISAMRRGDGAVLAMRWIGADSPLWLSAVVLEELYAGVAPNDRKHLDRLHHDFEKADRLLTPNIKDWVLTGQTLAGIGLRYGYESIGRGRLTNDTLLAMSAARLGLSVMTANAKDFERIASVRDFHWQHVR